MKFKQYLNEDKFLNAKKYEKILYGALLSFLKNKFNLNSPIEVSLRKPSKKRLFGWIDLIGLKNGKYKIIIENQSPLTNIGAIAHEFTHILQFHEGRLDYTKDEKNFIWNHKVHMSIKDYNKITNLAEYKQVPWEKEAYKNQEEIPSLFLKSKEYKDLKGLDINLDFIMDNI